MIFERNSNEIERVHLNNMCWYWRMSKYHAWHVKSRTTMAGRAALGLGATVDFLWKVLETHCTSFGISLPLGRTIQWLHLWNLSVERRWRLFYCIISEGIHFEVFCSYSTVFALHDFPFSFPSMKTSAYSNTEGFDLKSLERQDVFVTSFSPFLVDICVHVLQLCQYILWENVFLRWCIGFPSSSSLSSLCYFYKHQQTIK